MTFKFHRKIIDRLKKNNNKVIFNYCRYSVFKLELSIFMTDKNVVNIVSFLA